MEQIPTCLSECKMGHLLEEEVHSASEVRSRNQVITGKEF